MPQENGAARPSPVGGDTQQVLADDFEAQMSAGRTLLLGSGHKVSTIVEAEKRFRHAVAMRPADARAMAYLAWSLDNQGRWTEAKEHYESALRLDPNLDIARERYAIALEELNVIQDTETSTGGLRPFARFPETIAPLADVEQAIWRHILSHIRKDAARISKASRVVTIGSCFAANLANSLRRNGVGATNLTVGEAVNSTYANREFFEWALGSSPAASEEFSKKFSKDEIGPLLRQADLLIYTLGVAPCFFESATGEFVLPQKGDGLRGVMKGRLIFRTTTVSENYENLKAIVSTVRQANPAIQIIFPLSPVPLTSTLEPRSAMEADCISKATLRIAVDQVVADHPFCVYWPSFEIVRWLGAYVPGMYGEEDGTTHHVSERVVDLIVGAFLQSYSDVL